MKTALITGPTGGIGKATAEALVIDHHLILWCRKPEQQNGLVKHLKQLNLEAKIHLCGCDLSDWDEALKQADGILEKFPVIDTLVLNAGQFADECRYVDGLEINFRSGHLGHMLLALRLKPSLERSSDARLVVVSSEAHRLGKPLRAFQKKKNSSPIQEYADLKLANRLFALSWSRHYPQLPAFSLHPGVVGSGFGDRGSWWVKLMFRLMKPFILTPAQGAATTIWLCKQSAESLKTHIGGYFIKSNPVDRAGSIAKKEDAEALWKESLKKLAPWLSRA